MPKGIYQRDPAKVYRPKPTCECTRCKLCKAREIRRRYDRRRRALSDESDEQLGQRMVEYFKVKGWDP